MKWKITMKMSKWNTKKKSVLLCLAMYVLLVVFDFCLIDKMDDSNFRDGIANFGNIFAWMKFWGESWSGRVIPQGIMVLLMQIPDIGFHLCNAGMWMILLYYTWRNLDVFKKTDWKISMPVLFFAVFAFIPVKVLDDSVFWKSANVTYLWGMAAFMAAIYPFTALLQGKKYRRRDYVISLIACLYAAGAEQCGALMSGIMICAVVMLVLRKHGIEREILILTAFSCALTAYFFLLPGNSVRMRAEILGNFQNFDMFSPLDRALWGITYAIGHAEGEIPELMALLAVVNLVGIIKLKRKDHLQEFLSWCTVIYFVCNFFDTMSRQMQEGTTYMSSWFSLIEINTTDFGISRPALVAELINVGMIVLLGMDIAWITEKFDILAFGLYFGGFATMWLMGFSPTIYASAERPRFIGYYCLLCCLFSEVLVCLKNEEQRKNNIS